MFSVSLFRKVRHNAHNEKRAKLPKLTIWHEKSCGSGHKKRGWQLVILFYVIK